MLYRELPGFIARLRSLHAVSARCMEFAILTAARTGEVVGARWNEIDLKAAVWTVPAPRMKAGRIHRVPLCERAVAILAELAAGEQDGFVFPGGRSGRALSNVAMDMTLRRMKLDVTVHGFRSSFRDWAAEQTDTAHELAEMALAHTIGSKVEAAYRRGDMFQKRRELMAAWGAYCGSEA